MYASQKDSTASKWYFDRANNKKKQQQENTFSSDLIQ